MILPLVPQRTTTGFVFPNIERAINECFAVRRFGQKEIEAYLSFFKEAQPGCVFCGSKDVKRWDHLYPIRSGGDTVLGNMVLACSTCDDSKRDKPFELWMLSDAPKSPKMRKINDINHRIKQIKDYISYFNYKPRLLEERLAPQQLEMIVKIRSLLKEARLELEQLTEIYRKYED